MILVLLFILPFVYSTKSSENDLLSLESGYHKPTYEPTTGYYSPPVPYKSYEEPQLEYISHPYPTHETPKSDAYVSKYYKTVPKSMSYPPSEPHYSHKPYSSAPNANSYPDPNYGYDTPSPPKMYESYKPKKYSHSSHTYSSPIYQSEYSKYKPIKKLYKVSHMAPNPYPSSDYPIDDYYQYKKPEQYSAYPPPKQSYDYPYKPKPYSPEYSSYGSAKAYPAPTYLDYPKPSSYGSSYSPPSSYYSYEPKAEYPTAYEDDPYYSSNTYP